MVVNFKCIILVLPLAEWNLATLTTVFSFRVIHYALQRTAHLIEWFRFDFLHYLSQASYAFLKLVNRV